MHYKAPYLPYDKIRIYAADFLETLHPSGEIPIPIEEIIEFELGMDIIPMDNLFQEFGTDGFLANNFQALYIDNYMMTNRENRYRFTLAHEIGHRILHKDFYERKDIKSIDDWIELINTLDSDQYSWFERHAYNFAGLVLVPSSPLLDEYGKALGILEDQNFEFKRADIDMINEYASVMIAKAFRVSDSVINKRIDFDKLTPFSIP